LRCIAYAYAYAYPGDAYAYAYTYAQCNPERNPVGNADGDSWQAYADAKAAAHAVSSANAVSEWVKELQQK